MSVKFVRVLAVSVGVIAATASLPPATAAATTGFLDKTFSGDGRALTNVHNDDSGEAVAVQADGKIVVVGSSSGGTDIAVVRYDTDGSLDATFGGGDGIVITDVNGDDAAYSVAIQGDQKIIVGGTTDGFSQAVLLRYDTTGPLDASFGGGDGITTTTVGLGAVFFDLAIQGDGSIVGTGAATLDGVKGVAFTARYDGTGALDTTFASPDGYVTTNLGAGGGQMMGVALDGGKVVVAGSSFSTTSSNVAVLRYTSAGVLDSTFGGGDGKVTTDVGTGYDSGGDVAVDGSGNIDVVGAGGNKDAFLRYDDTGTLDPLQWYCRLADLANDLLVPLGSVITPAGLRHGHSVGRLVLHAESGDTELDLVPGGLELVDLAPGQTAVADFRFRDSVRLGGKGRQFEVEVAGGLGGLLVDLRDVPLKLPERHDRRREQLEAWQASLWAGLDQ